MTPRNNPYGALVYTAHAGVVDIVLVAGRIVKENGALVDLDVRRIRELAAQTNDHLFENAHRVAAVADASRGGNWLPAALKA